MADQIKVAMRQHLHKSYKTTNHAYTDLPLGPLTSIKSITSSISDDDDEAASLSAGLIPLFSPTASFQVQSDGKSPFSFPLPPKQLQIPVFSPSSSTSRPVYLSIRPNRRSGSCYLVDAEDTSKTSIARTSFRFGPCRDPEIRLGPDDDPAADVFEMRTISVTSRSVRFESQKHGIFEWRYGKKQERAIEGKANNLLVLEKIDGEQRRKVAQLVRSDETRTPGTKASHAGNGGRLDMDLDSVDEVLVLVTLMVMLKKEIDRLRMIQVAMMSGAGSGGA